MNTYRLLSSELVHTLGIVKWAINAYRFPRDRKVIRKVMASYYGLPTHIIDGLLSGEIPYTIEGDAVVIRWNKKTLIPSHLALMPFIAFYMVVLFSSCTTTQPISATGEVDGGKRGTATVVKVCGFVLSGDGSIGTAAKNGTVRFVQSVDVRRTSVLGLVTWSTTIVTGE